MPSWIWQQFATWRLRTWRRRARMRRGKRRRHAVRKYYLWLAELEKK